MIARVQSSILLRAANSFNNTFKLSTFNTEFVTIKIQDENHKFPNVWLRDNCQCDKCFHATAKSRIIDYDNFNIKVNPSSVVSVNDKVKITWNDGHQSVFGTSWLQLRSFSDQSKKFYSENLYIPKKIKWHGKEFEKICSKFNYEEIVNYESTLRDWLQHLAVYGVGLIENTPSQDRASNKIVDLIGFPKQTHYGIQFIVQNVKNTANVAYQSSKLPLHVDLPYYGYCPGVNMLHCLVQTTSSGGENFLSDAHYTAEFMRENHPDKYKLLTDIDVEWSDIGVEDGREFFKLHRSPVISLDKYGEIDKIRFSIPQRGSQLLCSVYEVASWYEAHNLFLKLNEKFAAKFKAKAGTILCFDNVRLLHGRSSYEDNSDNVRKLIGTYLDWDEIYSKLRCLKVRFNKIEGI